MRGGSTRATKHRKGVQPKGKGKGCGVRVGMEQQQQQQPQQWYVRNINLPDTARRSRWHKVTDMTKRVASTVCGQVFDYPAPSVVFAASTGEDTHLCQEGCFDGN